MPGDVISGLIAIVASGVTNGSFAVPAKHITLWKWEHVWLVYSAFALAILPVGLVLLFAPEIISQTLRRDPMLAAQVGMCGLLFGAGSVLFGISLARLGIAVTNALVSGVVVFLGSLGPILIGAAHIDSGHLLWLVLGLGVLVLSLILCAAASTSRDRSSESQVADSGIGAKSAVAVLLAVLAGILSSMLNIGFASGARLIQNATIDGSPPALASMAVWVPALLGGLVFNVGYPAYLISRRHSWPLLFSGRQGISSWSRASFMGFLWFGSNLLYGYGASLMGSAGSVYGWALSSAASILVSNAWGALTGEWKGAKLKAVILMWTSTLLLILSFIILVVKRMPD
jgi:L-rhamnose-H+ transport protein